MRFLRNLLIFVVIVLLTAIFWDQISMVIKYTLAFVFIAAFWAGVCA